MTDIEDIERRLAAVERTLTDGETGVAGLPDAADAAERLDRLAERVDALEAEAAEREAATQALRGYVGQERSLGREVERTAESALATAESTRDRLRRIERLLSAAGIDGADDPCEDEVSPAAVAPTGTAVGAVDSRRDGPATSPGRRSEPVDGSESTTAATGTERGTPSNGLLGRLGRLLP